MGIKLLKIEEIGFSIVMAKLLRPNDIRVTTKGNLLKKRSIKKNQISEADLPSE